MPQMQAFYALNGLTIEPIITIKGVCHGPHR